MRRGHAARSLLRRADEPRRLAAPGLERRRARAGRFRRPPLSRKLTRSASAAERRSRAAERDRLTASREGVRRVRRAAPATQVDQSHETGRVRGVLCFNCNSGLGLLGDDPEAMHRAADYLEGNAWKPTLVAPGVYRPPS
ncbi:endonuclease domain-containing protein [Streptomyces sp. NPDC004393]|uniref:endonuclease domain-containing protein n=1 Tax=Streptomyces sp. NPDC004533 TaxID=3154278 RepID=UPI0033B9C188